MRKKGLTFLATGPRAAAAALLGVCVTWLGLILMNMDQQDKKTGGVGHSRYRNDYFYEAHSLWLQIQLWFYLG